jgi:hypothetical protein
LFGVCSGLLTLCCCDEIEIESDESGEADVQGTAPPQPQHSTHTHTHDNSSTMKRPAVIAIDADQPMPKVCDPPAAPPCRPSPCVSVDPQSNMLTQCSSVIDSIFLFRCCVLRPQLGWTASLLPSQGALPMPTPMRPVAARWI